MGLLEPSMLDGVLYGDWKSISIDEPMERFEGEETRLGERGRGEVHVEPEALLAESASM